MFVADAHCDTLSELGIRKLAPDQCHIDLDKLLRGGVGLQVCALFSGTDVSGDKPYERALEQLRAWETLGIPKVTEAFAPYDTPHGVLSIEGGEILGGSLSRLHEFYALGVRMIALTWNHENNIGTPHAAGNGGLKPFGLQLIREMNKLKVLCDVSHLNEDGFWDVMDNTTLPPVASHSNLRELRNTSRNLWREQAKAIINRKGFIGVNFYAPFLTDKPTATIEDVVSHIDGFAQLGGIDCVGFGSDFDGIPMGPIGLEGPDKFPALIAMLFQKGYAQADVEKICGLNLLRVLKETEA